jgi:hypothetical protein
MDLITIAGPAILSLSAEQYSYLYLIFSFFAVL